MYGPKSGRNCAQLNAFYSASLDKCDRVLEVVMSVLRAVGSEDASRRHRFAVNRFNDSHFVGADLNQRHFAHDFLEWKLDEVQARLQYVRLNTNFTFGRHHSSRRHLCSEVSSFFDRDLTRADVYENTFHHNEEEDKENKGAKQNGQHRWNIKVLHGMSLSVSTGGS